MTTAFDEATTVHVHEWHLIAEEHDVSGTVREFLCSGCHEVDFA